MRLAIALIIIAVALAACSTNTSTSNQANTPVPSGADNGHQAASPSEPSAPADSGPNAGKTQVADGIHVNESDYQPRAHFEPDQLTTKEFATKFTASGPYVVTLIGQDSTNGYETYTKTWYRDGDNLAYVAGTERVIKTGNRTFVCENASGWTCTEKPYAFYTGVEADIHADPSAYPVKKVGVRPLAGTSADCYLIDHNQNGDVTYCLGPNGAPLLVEANSPSYTSKFVAQSYSADVPSGIFTLPALPAK